MGNFSGSRVVGFILCPLIADSTVSDLIVPRKRLENSLRVHDDVNVSGRSAIRDTDRLISLVLKSGPLTTLQKKKGMKASLATQNWKILFPVLG